MKVDFIILSLENVDIVQYCQICLAKAYDDNYKEPPSHEDLMSAIEIRGMKSHKKEKMKLCRITVDFDTDDIAIGGRIVKEFCTEIISGVDSGIVHLLKLYDPYLKACNKIYADEIFEIEMRLREALSFVFIDEYKRNYYNLLRDISIKPLDDNQTEQFQSQWENEFFYLLFSHYSRLNERKIPNKVTDLIQIVEQTTDYQSFRQMLTSKPIQNETYSDFLASLKTLVDPIEKLRNCIAHNRTIPQRIINDYETAKEELLEKIKDLFYVSDDHTLFWEDEAKEALQSAMQNADWQVNSVKFYDIHSDHYIESNSIDELRENLEALASDTATAYMPFESGEPVFTYDPQNDVETILEEYREQIEGLGWIL
ncbi:MAG TPA: hypothetical protein PKB02_17135 [Anaerohalosphaeraceae bacterium]|nr:hypothetical protein [Anaerohalosphaeraceae bacterium]